MKADFCSIPPRKPGSVDLALEIALSRLSGKIIVLDDDPTGTQTVHDVPVFTSYDEASVKAGMLAEQKLFFLLTNSRSFLAEKTEREHRRIARNVCGAARATRADFLIVSRGDSTLRGHWPLETVALKKELAKNGYAVDGEIICPFFPEGGRVTAGDIHYVEQDGEFIPAGETEFARDATFGYRSSNLKEWVEEKSEGSILANDVVSVSLEELRTGLDAVQSKLLHLNGGIMIVNAVEYTDLEAFVVALCGALGQGRRFLFRSAAALPRVLGGVAPKPFLTGEALCDRSSHGGLVVVGSHVARSTRQLGSLLELDGLRPIELDSDLALEPELLGPEIRRAARAAEKAIFSGETVALYTKREPLEPPSTSPEEKLALSVRIADAVTQTVRRITVRPSFIIAKGGITSSQIVTNALGAKRAWVMGQAASGVPVWRLGPESRYSGLPYIIFPGNVGETDTLKNIVSGVMQSQTQKK